jgi:radical SAM superfamily enzyme YgiQ (UPF0313 family)
MRYDGLIIRPPNEADSLILQVAVGCSHNLCTFCPAFKSKQFRSKPLEQVLQDIDSARAREAYGPGVRRVFLCDGDPLILPSAHLDAILERLNGVFPRLQRIGIYGNAKSILRKTPEDLAQLRTLKLGIVYLGLESGDPETLIAVRKGATPEDMIQAAHRVRAAGIKLNVTVLLGLGGVKRSAEHARATIEVLNQMQPNHVAALTLMVVEHTPLYDEMQQGRFTLPGTFELLAELREIIAGSELKNCLFFSNHASNYFPVQARLPHDKQALLERLDRVLQSRDTSMLRPESSRGL